MSRIGRIHATCPSSWSRRSEIHAPTTPPRLTTCLRPVADRPARVAAVIARYRDCEEERDRCEPDEDCLPPSPAERFGEQPYRRRWIDLSQPEIAGLEPGENYPLNRPPAQSEGDIRSQVLHPFRSDCGRSVCPGGPRRAVPGTAPGRRAGWLRTASTTRPGIEYRRGAPGRPALRPSNPASPRPSTCPNPPRGTAGSSSSARVRPGARPPCTRPAQTSTRS